MAVEVSRQYGQRTQDIEVLMTAIDNRAEWWSDAACSTADPELFFPVSSLGPALRQVAQAKALCARCHVQQACLGYALDTGPVQGIWGGTTEAERQLVRQRERKARAPLAQEPGSWPGPRAASPVAVTCITGGARG
jgi:WhiB family redox-sensing transcriptional regulator